MRQRSTILASIAFAATIAAATILSGTAHADSTIHSLVDRIGAQAARLSEAAHNPNPSTDEITNRMLSLTAAMVRLSNVVQAAADDPGGSQADELRDHADTIKKLARDEISLGAEMIGFSGDEDADTRKDRIANVADIADDIVKEAAAFVPPFVPPSRDKSTDGNKADEQQDNFGMTANDFLHAISKLLAKVRIGDQTSQTVEYGIGQCVVVDGELDDHQFLYYVNVAPTDDRSGCGADNAEVRTATASVMKVLTGVSDMKQNSDTLLTLAQNLKEDPVVPRLRSSETKVGQRTMKMQVTLDSRIEYAIYPR